MIERGQNLRLTLKPRYALGIAAELVREYLDDNLACQLSVTSPVDSRIPEFCSPDLAEIPFDHILDEISGSDPPVMDYLL
jgi:hypothetical protein